MKEVKSKKVQKSLNQQTGELLEVTTENSYFLKTKAQIPFFFVFPDSIDNIFSIKSSIDLKVILKFCCMAQYNTNTVLLPTKTRKELCSFLHITPQQLSNSIANLKGKNLVTGEKGTYLINPNIFWKGSTHQRDKLLKNDPLTFNVPIE